MATSIGDLLHIVEHEAPYATDSLRQATDAAGALTELARALRMLSYDGLDVELNGPREEKVNDLANACTQFAAGYYREPLGRLTVLSAAAADVIGMLRADVGRAERWAIALEIAGTIRAVSTYAADEHSRRPDLARVHQNVQALTGQRTVHPPDPERLAVLDRPIPTHLVPEHATAARIAMESLIVLDDRLRAARSGVARPATLLEVFAVTRAVETTARYASAAAATLDGRPIPDTLPAAETWHEVRDRLRPFTTVAPQRIEDRDLGLWAQRTHLELRREFDDPDHPQLTGPDGMKADAIRDLQSMVNQIPDVADHLAWAVAHLADVGDLHALASRLPYREGRMDAIANHRPVVADRVDVITTSWRLKDASLLAAEVAVDLDRCTAEAIGRPQPGAIVAHQAWLRRQPRDRNAALLAAPQFAEASTTEVEADVSSDVFGAEPAPPRQDDVAIEHTAGPDLEIG